MHTPQPVSRPVSAAVLEVLAAARNGRLVVCLGAGVSVADDAALPTGKQLGERLDQRLASRLQGYISPANPENLIAVADAAFDAAGGLEALQAEVLQLAEFNTATPNYGHLVLGMLLAEGAFTALSWNWDSCIERAAPPREQFQVARTATDLQYLQHPHLAKVHGCATMPPTLLITSEQLAMPSVWTEQAFAQRLQSSTMVFIGIGDVADYAERRIADLIQQLQPPDVRIVARGIRDGWAESVWARVLPNLPDDRRIQEDADDFLDELGRAWAKELIDRVLADARESSETTRRGVERVTAAIARLGALDAIAWSRAILMRPETGSSAIRATNTGDVVLAAGVLASQVDAAVDTPRPACCSIGDDVYELLAPRERAPASEVQREARRRAEALSGGSQLAGRNLCFVVGGTVLGPLDNADSAGTDLLSTADSSDLIDGPSATQFTFRRASELLQAAA